MIKSGVRRRFTTTPSMFLLVKSGYRLWITFVLVSVKSIICCCIKLSRLTIAILVMELKMKLVSKVEKQETKRN